MTACDSTTAWASLKHGGLLLAPNRLADVFPDSLPLLPWKAAEQLRRAVIELNGDGRVPAALMDAVLEQVLGLGRPLEPETGRWAKGSSLGAEWTHRSLSAEAVKPQRVWQGEHGAELPVFVDSAPHIGIGRGRRMPARVAEWLRATGRPLAILTNGRQWRLIHATLDASAFAEWDTSLWFEEGEPGPQVTALRALLAREKLTPPKQGEAAPLVAAITASRKGQGELSSSLGERVRRAVELLIRHVFRDEELPLGLEPTEAMRPQIYRAATRVVMRMVVILFAEARDDLLPRSNPVYHLSYGLQGLRESLQQAGAGTAGGMVRLARRYSAWPRVLSLFRLIYHGSPHKDLTLPRYGGGLFEPGDTDSPDILRRALSVLEDPARGPTDADVYRMLDFLCVTEMRVRQGKAYRRVPVPVDFSDLGSEYIGILYEGLLDYELRRAAPGDPMVFLNLGDQPALPLSRLESMADKGLADLVDKLKVKRAAAGEESEETEDDSEEPEPEDEPEEDEISEEGEAEETASADEPEDARRAAEEQARAWARRAVETGKLVRKPRGKKKAALADYKAAVDAAAKSLIARTVLPGEWFLVRWGGTRKGSGTFYTRPALAVPTVHRTLRPLCYEQRPVSQIEEGVPTPQCEKEGPNKIPPFEEGGPTLPPFQEGGSTLLPPFQEGGSGGILKRLQSGNPPQSPFSKGGGQGSPFSKGGGQGSPFSKGGGQVEWTPKLPEEILALKVCDPAMGSGSFLVAALRFLTDALFASLHHHGRIARQDETTLVTLAEGKPSEGKLVEETLPCRPESEDFEPRLRAVLKRYVVERCLYGVDLDPLAVELGRLALWVETLDRDLPFEFLDHKLKCGNALVGCWFDRFRDYPVLAWNREGGDKGHGNGVHFESGAWTKAIKQTRNGVVKRELIELISGQKTLDDHIERHSPEELHDEAFAALEAMHRMPVFDAEARGGYYREHLRDNPALTHLREGFDAWCAVWFWPADRLDVAPTPRSFNRLSDEQRKIVRRLRDELRFFHWEMEFPDVFCRRRSADGESATPTHSGFHAVVGNPPWEIQKPNSKEFFSNLDPLYRTYGKQEALRRQKAMFEASEVDERAWLEYKARFKALSNAQKSTASPFGDGAGDGAKFGFGKGSSALHAQWASMRGGRAGYADPRHAYRHQGSADINTYKMFLEQAHALLCPGGRLGMIVPSGLYTDKGTTALRELFLEQCRWQWLFGFENRLKIFDIHRSFKFCPVIVRKGGVTEQIRAAFMRHELSDWAEAERHVIPYARDQVTRFSPRTRAILEIREKRDLEVLEKIYANSVLLGDDSEDGWGIEYATEFHMTNDSKLFPPRPWWEERGYVPDEYGRWIKFRGRRQEARGRRGPEVGWIHLRDGSGAVAECDIEDVALPLYEGRMIGQFDFSQKGWVSGKGRTAVWREIPWTEKVIEPQYLMAYEICEEHEVLGLKVPVMNISSATNARTVIAAVCRDFPCNHALNPTRAGTPLQTLALAACADAFVFDAGVRARLGGLNLSFFVLDEVAIVPPHHRILSMAAIAAALSTAHILFAPTWLRLGRQGFVVATPRGWRESWALTDYERLRLRSILDAVVAELYGLDWDDLAWILRACDHPVDHTTSNDFTRTLDPKGFWRVDKTVDPELRHPVLTLVAFLDLKRLIAEVGDRDRAIAMFCGEGQEAEGWMLPETLCLADYGLGHDDRARHPQPVRERLGPRFLPWQLEQSVEESWKECEIHARNILGEDDFAKLQAELRGGGGHEAGGRSHDDEVPLAADAPAQYRLFPGERTLFGEAMMDPARGKKRKNRR